MKMKTYLSFQLKDNRGVVFVYSIVYLMLLALAIWLRCLGAGDDSAIYEFYGLNSNICRIVMLVMAPIPILVLSSEMIERNSHPHLKIYGFRWNLKATFWGVGMSLVSPIVYICVSNLLFLKGIQYYIDNTAATFVNIIIEIVNYGVIIFVLASMAFILGIYSRSVLLALVITLFYTLIMDFFPFDLFGRDFPCFDVTYITNFNGAGWWHWPLYWFLLGVGFLIAGMINHK